MLLDYREERDDHYSHAAVVHNYMRLGMNLIWSEEGRCVVCGTIVYFCIAV